MLAWCAIKFIISVESEHYDLKAERSFKCDMNHISVEIEEITRNLLTLCVRDLGDKET